MKAVNLIPAHRLQAAKCAACLRGWVVGTAAYAVVLVFGWVTIVAAASGASGVAAEQLEKHQRQILQVRQGQQRLEPQLREVQMRLKAAQAVSVQPDWSILLGALAAALGDGSVLQDVELTPLEDSGNSGLTAVASSGSAEATAARAQPGRYVLRLRGLGQSQQAVGEFVLSLEGLGAFRSVRLVQTARQPYGQTEAISFNVDCTLDGGKEGP
jgi:Tfp pilus assembly protein PilN